MLGIIGGSGLYRIEGFNFIEEVDLETPFGKPSSSIILSEYGGKKVFFLARHGKNHQIPPHLINYRANLWAMKELGVKRILSISAVGSIDEDLKPGDFVIIDGFIDFTKGRKDTFYEGINSVRLEGEDKPSQLIKGRRVVHVDMTEPYCSELGDILESVLKEKGFSYKSGGVYVCTQGPRFETPAEIRMFKLLGGSVVGMTGYPEVALARELSMCYASLCVVANPAAGIAGYRLTSEEVITLMKKKTEEIKGILTEFVKRVDAPSSCQCKDSLEGAEV